MINDQWGEENVQIIIFINNSIIIIIIINNNSIIIVDEEERLRDKEDGFIIPIDINDGDQCLSSSSSLDRESLEQQHKNKQHKHMIR